MDFNLELRYYEILFIQRIQRMMIMYPMDKFTHVLDLMAIMADVNKLTLSSAVTKIVGNERCIHYTKSEYAVCLFYCEGLSYSAVRSRVKTSPNVVHNAVKKYKEGDAYIMPQFPLDESNVMRDIVQTLDKLFKEDKK